MKKFVLSFLLVAAISCDSDPSLKQAGDAFEKAGESVDKAFSDIGDEGVRFNDNFNDAKEDASDGLADANQTFNDEEHRFNQRVKDTGAKANADVLNEEARTTGRVKDTLEKANMDAVEEEHRFNDRFKTTSKKANMDTIAEGDKLTDRIVGSDDKTVDQHGDEIRDLQRRMALVEQTNVTQSSVLSLHNLRLIQLENRMDAAEADLASLRSLTLSEIARLDAKDVALQQDLSVAVAALEASLANESAERVASDADIIQDLLNEIAARQAGDTTLQNQVTTISGNLSTLTTNFNSFKTTQQLNNLFQQGQLLAAGLAIANLSSRMSSAESDIGSLETAVSALQCQVNHLSTRVTETESDIDDLEQDLSDLNDRVLTLESLIDEPCTLSVGTKTNVTFKECTSYNIFGNCTNTQTVTYKKASVTMQCLGKPAQVINDVMFRN